MIKMRGDKKGSLQDLLYLITILLVLGITIIFGAYIAGKINLSGMFNDVNGIDNSNSRNLFNKTVNNVLPLFDNIFVAVLVGGIIMTVILALALRSWTVFFVVGFVFTFILVMISAILANVFGLVAETPEIASTASSYTAMTFIMQHLPITILLAAMLVSVVLYGLWRVAI